MFKIFKRNKGTVQINYQSILDNQHRYRGDINNKNDWGEEAKEYGEYIYCIYYRPKKEFENLKKEDYRTGFGFNSQHYRKVVEKREELGLPVRKQESYEHKDRNGSYDITGKMIVSKYHPLHDKFLVDTKTGKKYHIDIVSFGYYYGMIMSLCTREDGTKSHGVREWEILSGGEPETIKRVEENKKRYKLVEKKGNSE